MESVIKYIIKQRHGRPVNVYCDPVASIKSAVRFSHEEDAQAFLTGFYGPTDPTRFEIKPIKITYEEVPE